jgi:hypothetical protein
MNQETQIIPISESGELVYTQWDQLTQISKQIMNAGISKIGNPVQINLIILKGKKLGLDIFEALENISVINNKTCISGALASALVDRSGLLVDRSHVYEGEGDTRKCVATVQRKDRSKTSFSFSIREAKQAGLYPGKPGSGWHSYPDSMLYWRCMGFCYRREFSDVLQGMYLTEEIIDEMPEVKIVTDAPPAAPDPETVAGDAHPIISAPSEVATELPPPAENTEDWTDKTGSGMMQGAPPIVGKSPALEKLIELAERDGVKPLELIEVVNGLRLFPRGVEHQIGALPEPKVDTLIKNWDVVRRQVARIRDSKEAV